MKRPIVLIIALLACLLVSETATAQARRIIPPSERPMFFTVGVGPSFWDLDRRGRFFGPRRGYYDRAKLAFDFGYHFSGDGDGPAIGATIEQTFAGSFYSFNPAFKFWYDIEIADLGIYVAPLAKAGYMVHTCDCFGYGTDHAFNLGVGVEGRVVFKNRWMVYLRPIQVDTYFGDFPGSRAFLVNYDVLIGGGVTF